MPTRTAHLEVDSRYTPTQKASRVERIKRLVKIDGNGCWLYQGYKRAQGYAFNSFGGKPWPVHRLMYALTKGAIPEGMFVCHTCDVRNCVNPDHLWIGTAKDNAQDCSAKGRVNGQAKTHCPKGHPYDGVNSFVQNGRRHCRQCRYEASMRHNALHRRRPGPPKPRDGKHPLHTMKIGETYTPENPTKYFRRYVYNSAARLERKFAVSATNGVLTVTRMA